MSCFQNSAHESSIAALSSFNGTCSDCVELARSNSYNRFTDKFFDRKLVNISAGKLGISTKL